MMTQRVKNVIPIFETQIDIRIVEEDGSYFIYMTDEVIEEVKRNGKVSFWHFEERTCTPFELLKKNLIGNKFEISKKTIVHKKYPINIPFPVYRGFQHPPSDY
ncbi:MAG: hypothetical protein ACMUIE_02145 [Thermoplasmatota archaeon]